MYELISKNVCIHKLGYRVNEYNNTYNTIKMIESELSNYETKSCLKERCSIKTLSDKICHHYSSFFIRLWTKYLSEVGNMQQQM